MYNMHMYNIRYGEILYVECILGFRKIINGPWFSFPTLQINKTRTRKSLKQYTANIQKHQRKHF